ncbi:MAG: DUF1801 domain-containing protein [Cytophagaceae bacterium]
MKKNTLRIPDNDLYDFLEGKPEKMQELFLKVREFIFKNSPGISEKIKWGTPAYFHKDIQIHYLMTNKAHITFGFTLGNHLKDPKNLLEGVGKNFKHVKIREAENLKDKALRALMKEAINYADKLSHT